MSIQPAYLDQTNSMIMQKETYERLARNIQYKMDKTLPPMPENSGDLKKINEATFAAYKFVLSRSLENVNKQYELSNQFLKEFTDNPQAPRLEQAFIDKMNPLIASHKVNLKAVATIEASFLDLVSKAYATPEPS